MTSYIRVMLLLCLTAEADDRESESDDDTDAERDLDEEGGDLGTEECDKLDEQMWGSDDEEPVKVRAGLSFICMFLCLLLFPVMLSSGGGCTVFQLMIRQLLPLMAFKF